MNSGVGPITPGKLTIATCCRGSFLPFLLYGDFSGFAAGRRLQPLHHADSRRNVHSWEGDSNQVETSKLQTTSWREARACTHAGTTAHRKKVHFPTEHAWVNLDLSQSRIAHPAFQTSW